MKRLTVFESVSLDGYFTDRSGDISWAHDAPDAEFDAFTAENASGGGTMLFGRITYEMMASFWPTPEARQRMPVVAEQMNKLPKVVFSRTLQQAAWSNTRLVKTDLVTEVRRLKVGGRDDLIVMGSGTIVAQLAQAGLIDELQLVLTPLVLGGGRTLFEGVEQRPRFRPTRTRTFANGKVFVTYQPAKS